ncbi:MAG: hypothetical protein LBE34_12870 [Flavobacteriaceae bacterium]|jgi:hypothetical protein|nr:hypothetical protein [Flavobacteriaceae bacterium]
MNYIKYSYCLLKYKHTPIIDESLNIGVLCYVENSHRFYFKSYKNLTRVKHAYQNVPEKTLREKIGIVSKKVDRLNKYGVGIFSLLYDFKDFIYEEFIDYDSTILQFDKFETTTAYNIDEIELIDMLCNNFIIDNYKENIYKAKEPLLIQKVFNKIENIKKFKENYIFYEHYDIKNSLGTKIPFDFAWQNGTFNLARAISFDLKEESSIIEKAYKNFGQFVDLNDYHYRFDALLAKPSQRNLFKTYDNIVELFNKYDYIKVVEEDEIDDYVEDFMISSIKRR